MSGIRKFNHEIPNKLKYALSKVTIVGQKDVTPCVSRVSETFSLLPLH